MQYKSYLFSALFATTLAGTLLTSCGGYKAGLKKYQQGEYEKAIPLLKAAAEGSNADQANFYIAQSYRKTNRIREAEAFYAKVQDKEIEIVKPKGLENYLDDDKDDAKIYYAVALEELGKYEEAKEQYAKYEKTGKNPIFKKRAKQELANLKQIDEILKKPSFYEVKNLEAVNTPASEFGASTFQNKMYFASGRKSGTFGATGTNYTGIYATSIAGGFDKPASAGEVFDPALVASGVNEAGATFSPDGKTMVFARGNQQGKKKGQKSVKLYVSNYINDKWTEPVIMPGISSDEDRASYSKNEGGRPKSAAFDTSPMFSPDGKTLYFSSDRETDDKGAKSYGRTDLYSAKQKKDGSWGEVKNLGNDINTEGDDMFPFLANDGRLFFASDGHPGIGGLDIYSATKDGKKVNIVNMGVPINSSMDDFAMVFTSDSVGYLSSNRENGKGNDDIYTFRNTEPKERRINYAITFKTIGVGLDKTEKPLGGAVVKMVDGEKVIKEFITKSGGYSDTMKVTSEEQFAYLAEIKASATEKYLTKRDKFTMEGRKVPTEMLVRAVTDTVITIEVRLDEYNTTGGSKFEVEVRYAFNSDVVDEVAKLKLNDMVNFMNDNPTLKIELGSHTDSKGVDKDNNNLAQRRAQAAVDYIVSKGIARERITPQGYGERIPKTVSKELAALYPYLKEGDKLTELFINKMKDKQRMDILNGMNRRTEVKITGATE